MSSFVIQQTDNRLARTSQDKVVIVFYACPIVPRNLERT